MFGFVMEPTRTVPCAAFQRDINHGMHSRIGPENVNHAPTHTKLGIGMVTAHNARMSDRSAEDLRTARHVASILGINPPVNLRDGPENVGHAVKLETRTGDKNENQPTIQ